MKKLHFYPPLAHSSSTNESMQTTFINLWEIFQLASSRTHLNSNLEAPDIENVEKMAAKLLPMQTLANNFKHKNWRNCTNLFFYIVK